MANNYALRNISYIIPEDEKATIEQAVLRQVEFDYIQNQKLEKEENELMAEAGCDEEITHDYELPFSPTLPIVQAEIEKNMQDFFRNAHGLPKTAVMEFENPSRLAIDDGDLKMAVEAAYKCKVAKYADFGVATRKEIVNDKQAKAINDIIKQDKFKDIINLRSNMQRHYSPSNLALILSQRPDAEYVCAYGGKDTYDKNGTMTKRGKGGWKDWNRQVNAGSKAIRVLTLCRKTLRTEEEVLDFYKYNKTYGTKWLANTIANVRAGKPFEYSYFKETNVFDIKDTIIFDKTLGDPYNDIRKAYDKELSVKGKWEVYDVIAKTMKEKDIPVIAFDGTLESIYNNLVEYADIMLEKYPAEITGIKTRTPLTGTEHEIETLFAVGGIAKDLHLPFEDKVASEIGLLFNANPYMDKVKSFNLCIDRGYALSSFLYENIKDDITTIMDKTQNMEQKETENDREH